MIRQTRRRTGIALLATLIAVIAIGGLAASALSTMSEARGAASNRMETIRARWAGQSCAAITVASIQQLLGAAKSPSELNTIWSNLDERVNARARSGAYSVPDLRPSGTTLSINEAEVSELRQFLGEDFEKPRQDSMIAAVLDWRDADSIVSPNGAEMDWYQANKRAYPRNAPLTNARELELVRGWESVVSDDISVDKDLIVIDRAPVRVLRTIRGFTTATVQWIDAHRSALRGRHISALIDNLPIDARQALIDNYTYLAARTSSAPEYWTLRCAPAAGDGRGVVSTFRIRHSGGQTQVVTRGEEYQ